VRVETFDAAARGFGRGRKQGLEFRPDGAQGGVVLEEGFVNFGEAFEDGGVGDEVFAHFDKARMMKTLIFTALGLFRAFP
jgi:hypothetical protein